MKKSITTFAILLFAFLCYSGLVFSQDTVLRNMACLDVVKQYKGFWDNDSLGHSGRRLIIGEKYLKNCNFKGMKWTDLTKVIGKPINSFSFEDKSKIHHRYVIFREDDNDWGAPGSVYLEFTVQNDKVIFFSFYYVDG